MPEEGAPEAPASQRGDASPEIAGISTGGDATAPVSGKRPSFRDIRRQLSEDELKQTGVQKLVIEDFERAETECESLRSYVERYHEKDKEVARLTEKLKTNVALEIITGATLAVGGGIVSLASLFSGPNDTAKFLAALGLGFVLLIGSTAAKYFQGRQ